MSKLTVHVSGARDMGQRFVNAFERAARDEHFKESHVTFLSWQEMGAALTPKRLGLIRYLHRESADSVKALACALSRDYKRVQADAVALEIAGLVVRKNGRLTAPWEALAAGWPCK
jgi:predicted transcriptional regulator